MDGIEPDLVDRVFPRPQRHPWRGVRTRGPTPLGPHSLQGALTLQNSESVDSSVQLRTRVSRSGEVASLAATRRPTFPDRSGHLGRRLLMSR